MASPGARTTYIRALSHNSDVFVNDVLASDRHDDEYLIKFSMACDEEKIEKGCLIPFKKFTGCNAFFIEFHDGTNDATPLILSSYLNANFMLPEKTKTRSFSM